MIDRYETPLMKKIWSDDNKYKTWLQVELAVCKAWTEDGLIPREALEEIEKKADFDIERIYEIENQVHHDMIAFVSAVAEKVGPCGRFIHLGLTSSDVLDTASSLLLKESLDVVIIEVDRLLSFIWKRAVEHKYTPCVGRTHGIHAEPMTFGLKLLNWYYELLRDKQRLGQAREQISYGKISGAVGTYAHCPTRIERRVCEILDLQPAAISTQILQRDRHAHVMNALALLGAAIERMAVEVRHLQRTEVLEALEPFGKKQKGSSAMPHKRNPILCERLTGMARLLRGYAAAAMENVALWHERDISHSSVERIIWPDAFHLITYMLQKMSQIVEGLDVEPENMMANLKKMKGLVFSQRVLLELVEKFGLAREEAYAVVQENAMKCWRGEGTFADLLWADNRVNQYILREELDSLFHIDYYLSAVDEVFSRFTEPSQIQE
ncbi:MULTISPECIES: adenylosuccinate lyase [Aminobacterium]|jgi:adenylosuccinate lyase|uniref:Adenylosuccinate lyase n=1 Tax=Aminobacterium colombiense (strain DSM 12261 / ALA-1) TaxID=572547 RepID=D5EF40_AMICL|nr:MULTISPECIES: adenylosuccinate lyase [Aminobacterium]MDD2378373.1 adenylosuccinate lyase [Aminobacterium colombiense]ADE57172.1 adenylosuccinate lyase [Aminobacterium colombiense DSM 12261]MDD3767208.1 adenylosuccinate lyase [Aminobacterium colombiense]MDD4264836.1 adenylosuccinate lyase [Aminobacterium colombiense]MDD4585041.1 adenylosuccinate lyase [Aminobacterium colombiense]